MERHCAASPAAAEASTAAPVSAAAQAEAEVTALPFPQLDAMEKQTIKISSHNINGFSRNKEFLKTRCSNEPDSIICLQEHWLRPPFKRVQGVNQLKNVHKNFDGWGTSAMKNSMEAEIRIGRPFGGTGFLWDKKLAYSVKPRIEYKHERVTVLEITDSHFPILCINVYFPHYDTSKVVEHTSIYRETLGFIESTMESNPGYQFIILADFNCNLYQTNHPFTTLIRDLMSRKKLFCCYDLDNSFDPSTAWTRVNFKKRGERGTLIDGILASEGLRDRITSTEICQYPDNLSDHLPVSIDIELFITKNDSSQTTYLPKSVNWSKIEGVRLQYANEMKAALDSIHIPFHELLHGNQLCDCNEHIFKIEKYFCDIVQAISYADKVLPRSRVGISKDYWSDELTDLKNASHDAYCLWRDSGKPLSGPIYELKRSTQCNYKLSVRRSKKAFDRSKCDKMHEDLLNGNSTNFWKQWQSIHGTQNVNGLRVNGKIDNKEIANDFATSFSNIYNEANSDQAKILTNRFRTSYFDYSNTHCHDDISRSFLSWDDIVMVMSKLVPGKASASFIKAEHILYGHRQLKVHLHLLFNAMIQHSYVPSEFMKGVISPIVKDNEGDATSLENYRGITLGHAFSFLFEHAALLKIDSLLTTDNLQFGYKKKHSTSHAIYTVKKCIDYFCTHGSSVYVSFLDCTKGFDRVSHDGLFLKLISRAIPLCWLRILIYWYSNLFSVVKWQDAFSEPFWVVSGVRQGGVLSARFWAIYMDELVIQLRSTKYGCYLADIFVASVLYADDLCLLAPTRKALQILLNTCSSYAETWCIKYNEKKTKIMYFGKDYDSFSGKPLTLNYRELDFVKEWKYLGITVVSGNFFNCSVQKLLNKFYRSSNSILNVTRKPSENVLMKLLQGSACRNG